MLLLEGKNIQITRGNFLPLTISTDTGYVFKIGDIIRFNIMKADDCDSIVFQKDFEVDKECTSFNIDITAQEMKFGEIISEPVDYWYEVEVNPDTDYTQTIIGYTLQKEATILTLLPEGGDKK